MKKKVILCLLFLISIFMFMLKGINTSAMVYDPLSSLGDYIVRVPVNSVTKVYIEPKLKSFVEENNIPVFKEEKKFWFITISTKYYYYANKYVDRIVESREIYNDVDSLIFMVNELEKEAMKYDEDNYKNLVLGYIRTINEDYDGDAYLGKWRLLAGDNPTEFINYINSDTSHGLRFVEYFSQFVHYGSYNVNVHGYLDEKYRRYGKELYLTDHKYDMNIDLIHMFASIDGIYSSTESSLRLGKNHLERDIVSWNGDLQQACHYMKNDSIPVRNDNMEYIFSVPKYRSPKEDIIADIDAMNITKTYIDKNENTISNSLAAYYRIISQKTTNRYDMFINTVILETELIKSGNLIVDFETEIYCQFNLSNYNRIVKNCEYYEPSTSPVLGIMRGDSSMPANLFGDYPSFEVRKYVASCFVNFIENNCCENFFG